jgi:hypothetical protein
MKRRTVGGQERGKIKRIEMRVEGGREETKRRTEKREKWIVGNIDRERERRL